MGGGGDCSLALPSSSSAFIFWAGTGCFKKAGLQEQGLKACGLSSFCPESRVFWQSFSLFSCGVLFVFLPDTAQFWLVVVQGLNPGL